MPSTVFRNVRQPKRKKCAFCPKVLQLLAVTVCDHGWPEDPCNAPTCLKHTQSVPQPDGKHVKEYCPKHRQEIAAVTSA
jgi:hypothetical protein